MLLEVCANSVQSAINAQLGGADRIELCRNLEIGGVTPLMEELREVRDQISIPVFVLVRTRGGDFVYNQDELNQMESDIRLCRDLGFEGVVIGALKANYTIDIPAVQQLINAAKGMKVTFHRAFDEVEDYRTALEQLKALGCHRILTSGSSHTALRGKEILTDLVEQAGQEIIIMPGGGVRPENIDVLIETGAREFHSSCIPANQNETDVAMVRSLKSKLDRL